MFILITEEWLLPIIKRADRLGLGEMIELTLAVDHVVNQTIPTTARAREGTIVIGTDVLTSTIVAVTLIDVWDRHTYTPVTGWKRV